MATPPPIYNPLTAVSEYWNRTVDDIDRRAKEATKDKIVQNSIRDREVQRAAREQNAFNQLATIEGLSDVFTTDFGVNDARSIVDMGLSLSLVPGNTQDGTFAGGIMQKLQAAGVYKDSPLAFQKVMGMHETFERPDAHLSNLARTSLQEKGVEVKDMKIDLSPGAVFRMSLSGDTDPLSKWSREYIGSSAKTDPAIRDSLNQIEARFPDKLIYDDGKMYTGDDLIAYQYTSEQIGNTGKRRDYLNRSNELQAGVRNGILKKKEDLPESLRVYAMGDEGTSIPQLDALALVAKNRGAFDLDEAAAVSRAFNIASNPLVLSRLKQGPLTSARVMESEQLMMAMAKSEVHPTAQKTFIIDTEEMLKEDRGISFGSALKHAGQMSRLGPDDRVTYQSYVDLGLTDDSSAMTAFTVFKNTGWSVGSLEDPDRIQGFKKAFENGGGQELFGMIQTVANSPGSERVLGEILDTVPWGMMKEGRTEDSVLVVGALIDSLQDDITTGPGGKVTSREWETSKEGLGRILPDGDVGTTDKWEANDRWAGTDRWREVVDGIFPVIQADNERAKDRGIVTSAKDLGYQISVAASNIVPEKIELFDTTDITTEVGKNWEGGNKVKLSQDVLAVAPTVEDPTRGAFSEGGTSTQNKRTVSSSQETITKARAIEAAGNFIYSTLSEDGDPAMKKFIEDTFLTEGVSEEDRKFAVGHARRGLDKQSKLMFDAVVDSLEVTRNADNDATTWAKASMWLDGTGEKPLKLDETSTLRHSGNEYIVNRMGVNVVIGKTKEEAAQHLYSIADNARNSPGMIARSKLERPVFDPPRQNYSRDATATAKAEAKFNETAKQELVNRLSTLGDSVAVKTFIKEVAPGPAERVEFAVMQRIFGEEFSKGLAGEFFSSEEARPVLPFHKTDFAKENAGIAKDAFELIRQEYNKAGANGDLSMAFTRKGEVGIAAVAMLGEWGVIPKSNARRRGKLTGPWNSVFTTSVLGAGDVISSVVTKPSFFHRGEVWRNASYTVDTLFSKSGSVGVNLDPSTRKAIIEGIRTYEGPLTSLNHRVNNPGE